MERPTNRGKGEAQKKYAVPRPYVIFGEYLAVMRKKAGLTQREVSLALHYSSAQFVSNFERGIAVPPLKKLKTIINLYGLNQDVVVNLILDAQAGIMRKVLLGKGSARS